MKRLAKIRWYPVLVSLSETELSDLDLFELRLKAGRNVTFCLQSCMIIPDGSDKTLRVDGRFDILHELNEV
jgi:hypothetical protein